MAAEHIVKSFDDELRRLSASIARWAAWPKRSSQAAVEALLQRDADGGWPRSSTTTRKIDALEAQIDAAGGPAARPAPADGDDLRQIVAALKISSDLERIGD